MVAHMCQNLEPMSWLLVSDNFGGAGGAAQKNARPYAIPRHVIGRRIAREGHLIARTEVVELIESVHQFLSL
jgi:hypothetical protein